MTKPILFVAGGTRGDIQPYVALAQYLHRHGIPVVVATSPRWSSWVSSYRIPWHSMPADPTDLLLEPQYAAALTTEYGVVRGWVATQRYQRAIQPLLRPLIAAGAEIIQQAAVVVAGVASQWAATIAERHAVPVVWGLLQPVAPTPDFASPLWPARMLAQANEQSHQILQRVMWQQWQAAVGQKEGGLMHVQRQPALFAFSRHLVPPWSNMAVTHAITGHWEFAERAPLPAPVRRFVAVGLPYVVATFGTPAYNEASALYDAVIAATAAVGMRLFVHIPPRLAARYRSDDRVFVSSEAFDFRLLYAGATAVIHHGGMGTLHSVTAQGVPSVIVPRGVDQFFWAQRAQHAQLTASVLPRRQLTTTRLTNALQAIILQPEYRFAARQLALQMAEEPAFAHASRVLSAYLA